MLAGKKVAVILPAYNAARTLERTVAEIPRDLVDEVILTDDGSSDETVALSRQLGLHTLVHESNRGYGGNQKTCYAEALARGADVVVMLHPDYQYSPQVGRGHGGDDRLRSLQRGAGLAHPPARGAQGRHAAL